MEAPDFIDYLERDLTAAVAVRHWILLTGALQEGAGIALQSKFKPRDRRHDSCKP